MIKMEGRLLNLGTVDSCGRKFATEDEYYVGGYYTNVKRHDENSICVIDACALRSMSIVLAPADKSLKIRKEENNV